MKNLVLASNNSGKLREFAALLSPFQWDVKPQSFWDIPEADEPHSTFIENALAKARHAVEHTQLPTLADDSGICVPVLAGEPGVHSARFAGLPKSDERNNARLVELLTHECDRRAYYFCVLVLLRHLHDPQPLIAQGIWWGEITLQAKGTGGFGYDPHFFLPELNCTAAQLSAEKKNELSHRGLAMRELLRQLQEFS